MEHLENQTVNEDNICLLSSAISELTDFLSLLEDDALYTKDAEVLWQLVRKLIGFKSRLEFQNGFGVWSTLKTSSV